MRRAILPIDPHVLGRTDLTVNNADPREIEPQGMSSMRSQILVDISDTQGHLQVDDRSIERLVKLVLDAENRRRASISIALVDDKTIHALNRAHLSHDWPTDVISFPLSAPGADLAGELVVSVETACATARELGIEPTAELSLYVIHGLLHLCGYDDHTEVDIARMRQREEELLALATLTQADRIASPPVHSSGGDFGAGEARLDAATPLVGTNPSERGPWMG